MKAPEELNAAIERLEILAEHSETLSEEEALKREVPFVAENHKRRAACIALLRTKGVEVVVD